jgi:hypothetical protein
VANAAERTLVAIVALARAVLAQVVRAVRHVEWAA